MSEHPLSMAGARAHIPFFCQFCINADTIRKFDDVSFEKDYTIILTNIRLYTRSRIIIGTIEILGKKELIGNKPFCLFLILIFMLTE